MITALKNVNKIYFLGDGYGIRGGANFMLEIIKFLLDNSIIPVGLIDFKDGYMRESLIDRNIDFVDYEEMGKLVNRADLIITHGGTGSILGPLKKGKKVIACARLKKYGEHVDDHQQQIVDIFSEVGYILKLDEDSSLADLIKRIRSQKLKKFVSNTDIFLENIRNEIEQ